MKSSDSVGSAAAGADRSDRVLSVDVLRGFDMFWLVGGTGLALALIKLCGEGVQKVLLPQCDHAAWVGFTFYDFIFPLFVFVVGMSVVFSLDRLLKMEGRWAAYKRIARRLVLMFLLGLFYYGGMSQAWPEVRLLGVLQRLALCYMAAGLLYCHLSVRGLIAVCALLLLGYWLLLGFVPLPGAHTVSWEAGLTWPNYIDARFLPGHKHEGDWDAEGLLSTLPAISSCLLGVFASLILNAASIRPGRKVLYLMGGGLAMVLAGCLWGWVLPAPLQFPVIKKIWTSSYALLAGGYSFLLMGFLYLVLDIWKIRWWATPLVWIGANPLTIYLARNMVDFNKLADRFVGGSVKAAVSPDIAYLLRMIVSLTLSLILLSFLYRKKIFLRV